MRKHDNDTIAAVSTPVGEGGIGIVRLSGRKSLSVADKIFVSRDKKKPSAFRTHTVHYGHIKGIDEVLLTVMRAPKSYTREDIVEINCHGYIKSIVILGPVKSYNTDLFVFFNYYIIIFHKY